MALVKTIKDRNTNDTIYPITKADAVYLSDNETTVEGALGDLSTISSIGDGTIAGAISTLNNNLTPTDSIIQIANSNISNLERGRVIRSGKVVTVDVAFTVSSTISGVTDILFTGLPKAAIQSRRFRIPNGSDSNKVDLCLAVTTNGTIINQWSTGGVTTGQWQGQFTYITSE